MAIVILVSDVVVISLHQDSTSGDDDRHRRR
jgi:hypothetical protein